MAFPAVLQTAQTECGLGVSAPSCSIMGVIRRSQTYAWLWNPVVKG